MATNAEQLSVALDALRHTPQRREPREQTVRIVEYTPFPRVGPDATPRIGFTRDVSPSGLCIGVDDPAPVGSLLRVTLRELNGRAERPCVDRVVWCARARDGRYWMGLEHLTDRGRG